MSEIFESIRQFLLSINFVEGKNESGDVTFTKTFELPKRQVVINGRKVKTPVETKDFVITSLGQGSMYNVGEEEEELQGFNMANNDIWVSNLEDFKFWLNAILK
jgi:hypothetical protein